MLPSRPSKCQERNFQYTVSVHSVPLTTHNEQPRKEKSPAGRAAKYEHLVSGFISLFDPITHVWKRWAHDSLDNIKTIPVSVRIISHVEPRKSHQHGPRHRRHSRRGLASASATPIPILAVANRSIDLVVGSPETSPSMDNRTLHLSFAAVPERIAAKYHGACPSSDHEDRRPQQQ